MSPHRGARRSLPAAAHPRHTGAGGCPYCPVPTARPCARPVNRLPPWWCPHPPPQRGAAMRSAQGHPICPAAPTEVRNRHRRAWSRLRPSDRPAPAHRLPEPGICRSAHGRRRRRRAEVRLESRPVKGSYPRRPQNKAPAGQNKRDTLPPLLHLLSCCIIALSKSQVNWLPVRSEAAAFVYCKRDEEHERRERPWKESCRGNRVSCCDIF